VPGNPPPSVWISRKDPEVHGRVEALVKKLGTPLDPGIAPRADSLCVVFPWSTDATGATLDEGLEAARTVALDAWFGMDKRRTVMTTPVTRPEWRDAAHALFAADGVPVCVIRDCPGFVAPRVVAQIVNIACDIAQQRIATPDDIDRAVTLGLGYPRGPLAMGDAMGPARVLALLRGLQDFYGDPRYRPSPWLTRRARLGVSLTTVEN
jgi:3-hydroxybutyryl-CoA dehydrogenase